jgi:hypothetical protein
MPAITHMAALRREIISMSVESFTCAYLLRAAVVQGFSTVLPSMKTWPMTTPSLSARASAWLSIR